MYIGWLIDIVAFSVWSTTQAFKSFWFATFKFIHTFIYNNAICNMYICTPMYVCMPASA